MVCKLLRHTRSPASHTPALALDTPLSPPQAYHAVQHWRHIAQAKLGRYHDLLANRTRPLPFKDIQARAVERLFKLLYGKSYRNLVEVGIDFAKQGGYGSKDLLPKVQRRLEGALDVLHDDVWEH